MKVAFRMIPNTWMGRVVQRVAGTPVHVEPVFSDGTAFVAVLGKRCAFVPPEGAGAYPAPEWRVLDLTPLGLDEARVRALCAVHEGTRYDTPRALLGWWLGVDTVGRVICSEVTAESCAGAATERTPRVVRAGLAALIGRPSGTPRRLLVAVEQLLELATEDALEARGVALLRGQGYAYDGYTPERLRAGPSVRRDD